MRDIVCSSVGKISNEENVPLKSLNVIEIHSEAAVVKSI